MTTQVERLPYGVGRLTRGWVFLIIILLIIIGFGAYAYYQQLTVGEVVTGMRDVGTMAGAPWGLYVAFVVYFVGVSFAGVTVAALIRLLNIEQLKPMARIAEVLTVISLLLGAFCIIADVGQPLRAIVNLFRYARPQSPFFGTFTLVISGYLFGSLVYMYLDSRKDAALMSQKPGRFQWLYRLLAAGYKDSAPERERRERTSFWLAIAILPLLVIAHSTLGFVFGLQVGRPGWFSGLQAPGFVALAGVSGVGMLILIAAIVRKALGLEQKLNEGIFKLLGNFLMILTLVYLYFMIVDLLTNTYTADQHEASLTTALLTGDFAWIYWGVIAALVMAVHVLLLQYLPIPKRLSAPSYWPRYVQATGVTILIVGFLVLSQKFNFGRQIGLQLSLQATDILTPVLVFLVLVFALSLIPLFRDKIINAAVFSGILVNLAAIGKRFLIVVPSQTHGTLMPYPTGTYSPSWVEYSIILGLFALGALLFILFMKVFPIMEIHEKVTVFYRR
jgi:molybdopterin-containing oxidoreductase family membrane subunit